MFSFDATGAGIEARLLAVHLARQGRIIDAMAMRDARGRRAPRAKVPKTGAKLWIRHIAASQNADAEALIRLQDELASDLNQPRENWRSVLRGQDERLTPETVAQGVRYWQESVIPAIEAAGA